MRDPFSLATIDVSIIVPAFNEERRLPTFLGQLVEYCRKSALEYEIIVVDDGSSDRTHEMANAWTDFGVHLEVISLQKNRGKGYAVKTGMLRSRGDYVLFMDADGSVMPDEIERSLVKVLEGTCDIFVGSRALHDEQQVLVVRRHRVIIGQIFGVIVRCCLLRGIHDTQCGFKIFTAKAARILFPLVYINGYGFDLEILYLAKKMGMTIREGPVSWRSVGRSQVNLLADSLIMLLNVFQIRALHSRRIRSDHALKNPGAIDAELERIAKIEGWHWWLVARRKYLLSIVKDWKAMTGIQEVMILDVGCGTGGNMKALQDIGQVSGIDDSQRSIAICREKGLRSVVNCKMEEVDYPDGSFDLITCLDVLEHVPDPVSAIRAAGRVMKSTGAILVMVPAVRYIWSHHDEALLHLRRYSRRMLRDELEEAGYEVIRMGYLFALPLIGIGIVRMLKIALYGKNYKSDLAENPSAIINRLLRMITDLELKLATKAMLPFGSSLFALARKRAQK